MRFPRIKDYENKIDLNGNKICRNCENIVPKTRRNYCSEECMNTFNEDHSWYFVRKAILRRDKYKCNICKKRFRKSKLDIDHIIPVRGKINPFNKSNLRTLCKECHKAKTKLEANAFKNIT